MEQITEKHNQKGIKGVKKELSIVQVGILRLLAKIMKFSKLHQVKKKKSQ